MILHSDAAAKDVGKAISAATGGSTAGRRVYQCESVYLGIASEAEAEVGAQLTLTTAKLHYPCACKGMSGEGSRSES
jgi:hypothetical protein